MGDNQEVGEDMKFTGLNTINYTMYEQTREAMKFTASESNSAREQAMNQKIMGMAAPSPKCFQMK